MGQRYVVEEVQSNFLDPVADAIGQLEEIFAEDPPVSKADLCLDDSFIGALEVVYGNAGQGHGKKETRSWKGSGRVPCFDAGKRLFRQVAEGILQNLTCSKPPLNNG